MTPGFCLPLPLPPAFWLPPVLAFCLAPPLPLPPAFCCLPPPPGRLPALPPPPIFLGCVLFLLFLALTPAPGLLPPIPPVAFLFLPEPEPPPPLPPPEPPPLLSLSFLSYSNSCLIVSRYSALVFMELATARLAMPPIVANKLGVVASGLLSNTSRIFYESYADIPRAPYSFYIAFRTAVRSARDILLFCARRVRITARSNSRLSGRYRSG